MKFYPKNIFKIIFIAITALCFVLSFFVFAPSYRGAEADGENHTPFLPIKSEEYHALNSPIHAYSDADITAITESTVLTIMKGDEVVLKSGRSSLNQVKRAGDNLFFNDFSKIYSLSVNDLQSEPQFISLTGTYFDINDEYIATIYESIIEIYKTDDFSAPYKTISDVQNKPVALNSESLFYVSGNNVIRQSLDEENFGVAYTYDNTNAFSLSCMIANENYVYFLSENKVYRLPADDRKAFPAELAFSGSEFDLGKVVSPKGLSFKGENLLITDNAGSVQEFRINGDTLEFTGYAVASGLTAYNRVAESATDIERYGKFVAALDGNKLTVIDTDVYNRADYNKDGFINKFVGSAPDKFALGNGTVLYASGAAVYIADLKRDGEDNNKIITELPAEAPNDIAYQSGVYYLIYLGTNSKIVKIDETAGEKIGEDIEFTGVAANIITADVFGNIYVAYDNRIYVNDGNGFSLTSGTVRKLATDLAGNLFVLSSDGKIYNYDQAAGEFSVAFETTLGTVKSFGLNFDKNEVYFIVDGLEQVYKTIAMNNASLQDVIPDADFNAATRSVRELKVYTAESGANVYSVSAAEDAFTFNGLEKIAAEYPFMSKFILSDDLVLYALASEKGVVLINENDLHDKTGVMDITEYSTPEKAYTTTRVNAYALPVIEENDTFAINAASGIIRLEKGTEITATEEFTVLGKIFYRAQAIVNGETVGCYIPKSFTLKTLAKDIEFNEYTVETVKRTVIYGNADLTDEITELESGDSVRVLAEENGVLKVQAIKNGMAVIGYIPESAVK